MPTKRLPSACFLLLLPLLLGWTGDPFADVPPPERDLRVFISVDLEGITGAVTPEQLGPGGFEYQRFREFMTDEVLAAIAGAREGGATHFVVADAHGNGQNLLIDRFPDDVEIVRSWPRPHHMMQGIDSTFHAAIFIGYHAAATNPEGVRAHTFSSANLTGVHVNGIPASEGLVNAAIAGYFGVPIIFVSGDDVVVRETRDFLGDVEGVAVKRALGFHSAATKTPAAAQEEIRIGVARAIGRLGDFRPYQPATPIELDVSFKNYRPAELLAYLPITERIEARTIRFVGEDILEVAKFLQFVLNYDPGLSP